ncbi:MAG TPA: pilus assembly PilX N-terminal domain-containing protein [Vicinamibacteria bacterium]|nr:pilus assembly PilX N-terminal domain-containing protein [Vicinamibacteria bacterium]
MKRETRSEAGFALVVALLALMMLTFLGLTLAMTTSTELQIATNYRWGQQALYNAEAGLEVAKAVMINVGDGQLLLPEPRAGVWDPNTVPSPVPASAKPVARFAAVRNFEGFDCDRWGNGTGYGQVLTDPNNALNPYQNVRTAFGQRLNGGFTVWIRRELILTGNTFSDNPVGESITVTSEGSAPYPGDLGSFQRANRAIRRLESVVSVKEGCKPGKYEDRDTGFDSCNDIT